MTNIKSELLPLRKAASEAARALEVDAFLVYATSTRQAGSLPVGGNVHPDVLPYFAEQLKSLGKKKKLALFIHTNGGDIAAPWPIVSLLREYCSELTVVVIERALSAGTLISIGADKIAMGPSSFLSPVDPQAHIPINGETKNVEVEDVTGYIEFVKNRAGLSGGIGLEKAFESLTNEIPPTVIGSLYRTHALIRSLAEKLLNTRAKKLDSATEKRVIENLTEKLFSHNHLISRKEAKLQVGLGDTIMQLDGDILEKVDIVGEELTRVFKLQQAINPQAIPDGQRIYEEDILNALLLGDASVAAFMSKLQIVPQPDGGGAINVNVNHIGWVKG